MRTRRGRNRLHSLWVPSVAVSAVVVNDERGFPLWEDDLMVASLSGGDALFGCGATDPMFNTRSASSWAILSKIWPRCRTDA